MNVHISTGFPKSKTIRLITAAKIFLWGWGLGDAESEEL